MAQSHTPESLKTLADRVLYLDETNVDSFLHYSVYIKQEALKSTTNVAFATAID